MNNTNIIVFVLILLAGAAFLFVRARGATTAKEMIANGALVLDVRSDAEFQSGHLPTAHHFPHDTIARRAAEIEKLAGGKDRPIVAYCASGARSSSAKGALMEAGFTNVVNGGGYSSLK